MVFKSFQFENRCAIGMFFSVGKTGLKGNILYGFVIAFHADPPVVHAEIEINGRHFSAVHSSFDRSIELKISFAANALQVVEVFFRKE